MDLPALVRACYIAEHKLEIVGEGGEQVVYRFPDGRCIGNFELVRAPDYEAFKRGFREGFEGRQSHPDQFSAELRPAYASGFGYGGRERPKLP